ncbi:MAG: hypothetical protein RBT41_11885, partial [Clostridia bacterium]|nr:hypothetical protein [Clostridia bacterium]
EDIMQAAHISFNPRAPTERDSWLSDQYRQQGVSIRALPRSATVMPKNIINKALIALFLRT